MTVWDRHRIKAEIERRYGSLAALSRALRLPDHAVRMALHKCLPRYDAAIAQALGERKHVLWPDRYRRDGRRRKRITGYGRNQQRAA